MTENNYKIRTRACHKCELCGTQGEALYTGLTDRLFGAPGVWSLKRCPNADCGLVWLDPMPLEEDIALAYRRYYTHQSDVPKRSMGGLAYQLLREILARVTGLFNEQKAIQTRYLGGLPPGKLLEIGCGAGDYIVLMRNLGWDVMGVETDPVACQCAREMDALNVHEGTLVSAAYKDNSFDAIVMNHVFEHVHDPVALLKECRRIIKPNGNVVVVTPNIESWGHSKFQENWRGLEPPRHIHIFSPKTMVKAARLAGFQNMEVRTTPANADIIIGASMDLERRTRPDKLQGNNNYLRFFQKIIWHSRVLLYQYREYRLWKNNTSIGEEVVLICQK